MKTYKLDMYDTDITVYEYTFQETKENEYHTTGISDDAERIHVVTNGEYNKEAKRMQGGIYAVGDVVTSHHPFKQTWFLVLAENIDSKQMANILIHLGAKSGVLMLADVSEVEVVAKADKPIAIDEDALEAIKLEAITGDTLGTGNMTITSGTIKISDVFPEEEKPKPSRKTRRKKTSE